MSFSALIGLVSLLITFVYFWIRKKFSYFEDNGIPHEKPQFPLGNLKGAGKEYHIATKIRTLYEKFKTQSPFYGIYFLINPNVVITDLDLVKNVLIKDFDSFHNRGLYNNPEDDPLTGHLFLLEDEAWKNMRTKLTPTFTSGKMKMMFTVVTEICDLMISNIKEEPNLEKIEMKSVLSNFTADVIGNVAFGLELNLIKNPDGKFRQMANKLLGSNSSFQNRAVVLTTFKKIARKLHMRLLDEEVSKFFLGQIRQTVDYRLKNKIQRNDVIDLLLKMYDNGNKEDGKITLNELAAQCFVFFIAGFETSSTTASFVLYNLSLYPEIQEKLRSEIQTVLKKYDGEVTYDAMQEMTYLNMVVEETLRLYSVAPQILRIASRDYKVPNTNKTIPKGSLVFVPIYAIHRDPDIYPEPEKFDPERFSAENKKNRHPMAFIPFGDGPRNCIGLRFGVMQTKIALIKLLTNFQFLPSGFTKIPVELNFNIPLITPKEMWLKATRI